MKERAHTILEENMVRGVLEKKDEGLCVFVHTGFFQSKDGITLLYAVLLRQIFISSCQILT